MQLPLRGASALVVLISTAAVLLAGCADKGCGAGGGDPTDAVSHMLEAIQKDDSSELCQYLTGGYSTTAEQRSTLKAAITKAGGTDDLIVSDIESEQMGNEHVISVTSNSGQLIGTFNTTPGESGATVAWGTPSNVTSAP